jgi:predicted nucleic acid-binding protein
MTRRLAGHNTLELARYEVGNAILKENRIFKTLTPSETEELTRAASTLLKNMTVLTIEDSEADITKVAIETGLTYYDASYLHTAKILGLTLATEDKRLTQAAKQAGTPTANLAELT